MLQSWPEMGSGKKAFVEGPSCPPIGLMATRCRKNRFVNRITAFSWDMGIRNERFSFSGREYRG
ncbi:hypothetical protein N9954_06775 [Maribacter sp.]|nr:hypothetical protein [Maribacter sp.]